MMRQLEGTRDTHPAYSNAAAGGDVIQEFLSYTTRMLAECLDYEGALAAIAAMSFPYAGSWCIIDVVESGGSLRRVDVLHPDPVKQEHARRLTDWPPGRSRMAGGSPSLQAEPLDAVELIAAVSDELLSSVATSPANLQDLRALEIGSVLVVPLIARGHVLGTITFITTAGSRSYCDADVAPAQELAARCAMTIDNARLFRDAELARIAAAELNQQLIVSSIRMLELAEEARDANQTKSRFLATMSHEIRTPINAIVGYTDLLDVGVAGPMSQQQKEYVARIQASSRHIIGLIDDILDLAKAEAGRMVVKRDVIAAAETVSAALSLVEPQVISAGVSVERMTDNADMTYRGDGDRARQVLVILLTNALKFTAPGGSIRVDYGIVAGGVEEAHLPAPGPWAYMSVEDTGIGISERDLMTIFDPFVQVDQANTRKRGGSGLGLAIGLELSRRMGGNLTVRSELGVGSCFTLWLPASEIES